MRVSLGAVAQRLHVTKEEVLTHAAQLEGEMAERPKESPQVEQLEVGVAPGTSEVTFRRLREDPKTAYTGRGNRRERDQYAQFHTSSKFAQHIDLSQAILHGDRDYIQKTLLNMVNQANLYEHMYHTNLHGRRATATRMEQCELLVKCVERMTLFDLIVYFYSDDIDFDTGEFNDGSIRGFDERTDIFAKGASISAAAAAANSSGYANDKCDALLEQFHRIEEEGDNLFAWKGGIVTEVCLASGTVEYVQLKSIAETVSATASDLIFDDVLLCSKQLFDAKDARFNTETEFVFVDPGSNTLRLPTGIVADSSNRDAHGKPLSVVPSDFFTFRRISAGK